jgi:uncharacterized protein
LQRVRDAAPCQPSLYHEEVGVSLLETKSRRLTRRSFLSLSAAALGGMAFYSGEISRHELSVEEHTIHLARLPDAFRGMRIVQISDFHFEVFTEAFFLERMVREVNRLKPDMVVLTGDFVTHRPLPKTYARRAAPECAAILSRIECPLRYAIMGNHDADVGVKYVQGPLEEHGIPMLVNSAAALERDGKRVWLAGLGSACNHLAHPEEAIPRAALADGETVIVLAHEPDIVSRVARYNVDLMLAGHTHGGQVRLPLLPPLMLPEYGRLYVEGWFQYGPTQLYVNRGIGTVNLPFRFNCPPEITVLTLA